MLCKSCLKKVRNVNKDGLCNQCATMQDNIVTRFIYDIKEIEGKLDACRLEDLKAYLFLYGHLQDLINLFTLEQHQNKQAIIDEYVHADLDRRLENYFQKQTAFKSGLSFGEKKEHIKQTIDYLDAIDNQRYHEKLQALKKRFEAFYDDIVIEQQLDITKKYSDELKDTENLIRELNRVEPYDLDSYIGICEKLKANTKKEAIIYRMLSEEDRNIMQGSSLTIYDISELMLKRIDMYVKIVNESAHVIDSKQKINIYNTALNYLDYVASKHQTIASALNEAFNQFYLYYTYTSIESDNILFDRKFYKDYLLDKYTDNAPKDIIRSNESFDSYLKIKRLLENQYIKQNDFDRLKSDLLVTLK